MDNLIDRYLSRCLKNWTANQQVSPPGREELLKKAAVAPAHWQEPVYFRTNAFVREFSNSRMIGYYTGEWLSVSFTMSISWPAQLATLAPVTS